MLKSTLSALLLTLTLLAATGLAQAGEDVGPVRTPDAKARIKEQMADARTLIHNRFPTKEDLGLDWFLPWAAPAGMPSPFRSETQFWRRSKRPAAWAQYFGMSTAEVMQVARKVIDAGAVKMKGGAADAPAAFRKFFTKPGMLSLALLPVRKFSFQAAQSKVMFAAENQTIVQRILKAQFLTDDAEKKQRLGAELGLEAIRLLGVDLTGHDYESALAALAREVRSVRRAASMTYLSGDADLWKATRNPGDRIPAFGRFTVDLFIMAREGNPAGAGDVLPAMAVATQKSIALAMAQLVAGTTEVAGLQLEKQMRQIDERIRSRRAQGADVGDLQERRTKMDSAARTIRSPGKIDTRLQVLDFGDNAWIVTLSSKNAMAGRPYAKFYGRLRNGNAVVNVTGEGTHDVDKMTTHLRDMLAAMDQHTAIFADE